VPVAVRDDLFNAGWNELSTGRCEYDRSRDSEVKRLIGAVIVFVAILLFGIFVGPKFQELGRSMRRRER
jgi:hypothetical protein